MAIWSSVFTIEFWNGIYIAILFETNECKWLANLYIGQIRQSLMQIAWHLESIIIRFCKYCIELVHVFWFWLRTQASWSIKEQINMTIKAHARTITLKGMLILCIILPPKQIIENGKIQVNFLRFEQMQLQETLCLSK